MIYNQLRVVPTPETLAYLSSVMSGSPMDLDIESWSVEIMTSEDPIEAFPDIIYTASVTSVKPWYDSFLQTSSLIVSLESADLQHRVINLTEQGVLRAWLKNLPFYNPYMTIKQNMPPLSRNFRTFVYQTANSLAANENKLEFGSEYVTQIDLMAPQNLEYNMAMNNERAGRRNY